MAVAAADDQARQHLLDAEHAVIGSILQDPGVMRSVLSKVEDGDFLNPTDKLIFQAARSLFRAGTPPDAIAIRNEIGQQYTEYLVQLMEITPTAANWEIYAKAMREQAAVQRVRDLAGKLLEAATLDECRAPAAQLTQVLGAGRGVDAWTAKDLLEDFFAAQDDTQPGAEYIRLGISELDEGTYLERGDVLILGGEPSAGKTALGLELAHTMSQRLKVGFFSLETAKRKIRDRLISHAMQLDFGAIKRRLLTESDWTAVAAKSADFGARDLTLIRSSGMTVSQIAAVSQAYGFEVIFVDYVQLVQSESGSRANQQERMADVSKALHTFAQSSGTLVVELAQFSRPDKAGGWREPDMHDLRDTGQFEQDADLILLLYRPAPKSDYDRDKTRMLKVAKNKEGRLGKWPLYFDGPHQTLSVLVEGGLNVQRKYVEDGKAARSRNKLAAQKAAGQMDITELPPLDGDVPF